MEIEGHFWKISAQVYQNQVEGEENDEGSIFMNTGVVQSLPFDNQKHHKPHMNNYKGTISTTTTIPVL